MGNLIKQRITAIWLVLVLATGLSWVAAHSWGASLGARGETAFVLIVAFFKVRLIMLDFMELREAPLPFRLFVELWAVIVCTALIAMAVTGLFH